MKYIILYNPKSKRGKTEIIINKIKKMLLKDNHEVEIGSILEIKDVKAFLAELHIDDKLVIVGGDGTLHYLVNTLAKFDVKQEIFVARKAGTGNDFVRSIKSRKPLIKINDYIKNIPYNLLENGYKKYFLNSVGMGIDAYVCSLVNGSIKGKTEGNYFKSALRAFKESKQHDIKITIDGVTKHHKKVWFSVVCNGAYFGGGMKISPKSKRLDDILEVVIIKKVPRFLLFLVFPSIYLGLHRLLFGWVKFFKGKHIIIEANQPQHVQYDGESYFPYEKLEVFRK